FAVMVRDLAMADDLAVLDEAARAALTATDHPIVLVPARADAYDPRLSGPSRRVGLMLPYTALHHRLLSLCARPLVMTSGNRSEEPIGIDDVVECLARALKLDGNSEIQIGGPDVTTYGGLMDETAKAMGRRPPLRIGVPFLTPRLSSLWLGLITPVDVGVARPLIEGLSTETVVTQPPGPEELGVQPESLGTVLRKAVAEIEAGG
ncbi:MAG TPA: Sua5/YciO/YrdC/YwlC family protein, partial [Solirubrobacterales bacterium]|nr:Sua5/YciO/YrdC/YwlC family protein [Solirubrobacterales bacterium]